MQSKVKSAVETTRVAFRKYPDGQIVALFSDIPWNRKHGEVTSYMHIGQHGAADYHHVIAGTKPATEDEYTGLLAELKLIGYENVKIITRAKVGCYDRKNTKGNT